MAMIRQPDHLVFMHIPKNGGTTFNYICNRFLNLPSIQIQQNINPLKNFTQLSQTERDHIKLLMGHVRFGVHRYFSGQTRYFTLLRDPIDRITSFYYYMIARNHLPHSLDLSEQSFETFIRQTNRSDVHNAQVLQISGIKDDPGFMLEKALENIEKWFIYVGFVEEYLNSTILFAKKFDLKIVWYKQLNQRSKDNQAFHISDDLKEEIRYKNAADYKLIASCRNHFNQEIEAITQLSLKRIVISGLVKLYSFYQPNALKWISKL